MPTALFLGIFALTLALDGLMILLLKSVAVPILPAVLLGSLAAIFVLAYVLTGFSKERPHRLQLFIAGLSLLVGDAVCILLVARNPLLHWPAAWVAGSLAAALLCGIGQWKTRNIMKAEK